jgi:hypothetical protein
LTEIGEALGGVGGELAGMRDVRGAIPKEIEFEVRGRTMIGFLELRAAFGHDRLGDRQGIGGIEWVKRLAFGVVLPGGRKDLVSRYFAAGTDSAVIIPGFDHGQGGKAVHGECACAHQKSERTQQDYRSADVPPGISMKAVGWRVSAAMAVAAHSDDASRHLTIYGKLPHLKKTLTSIREFFKSWRRRSLIEHCGDCCR